MSPSYREGDRVIVAPFSAYLHRPAPGGPGVVEEVHSTSFGDFLTVRLDSGKYRHPFFHQVEPEDHDANQDRHAWSARRWDA